MRKIGYVLGLFLIVLSCTTPKAVEQPKEGIWVAELIVMDNEVLPFNFKLTKNAEAQYQMEIYNAEEIIPVNDIRIENDSIIVHMEIFEGYLAGKFSATEIQGDFIKESLDRVVPFTATFGQKERFKTKEPSTKNVSGIWETTFDTQSDTPYIAKGIFKQQGDAVTGTFRTTTGDYRFLEGRMDGDSLRLSAFDGAHAFLFTAKITDSTYSGAFYSGNHSKEVFEGKRNTSFELPDEDSLTFLKEGYDAFSFNFPDSEGKMISLEDSQFKDKVVLVQIMGTWCPNCLDETKYYVQYLKDHPNEDIAVVALAFEYAKTEALAFKAIQRLKDRVGVEYPILLAQFGTSDKEKAQEKLPMLNHVLSYPTTLFIDKKGVVRKIHTGFNGPATGDKFVVFQKEFKEFVDELLAE